MRRHYDPEQFGPAITDEAFKETFTRWMAGECDLSTLAARIDASSDNPFAFQIVDHRHPVVAGEDWHGKTLRDFAFGRWGLHFDECAEDYRTAKREGILCSIISQEIDGPRRDYYRLIVPKGDELLVLSKAF